MSRNYKSANSQENALRTWWVDYTKTDNVIEQITGNLGLLEIMLWDPEFVLENLDNIREMVNSLKVFGAAAIYRECEEKGESPEIDIYLTQKEQNEIDGINHPNKKSELSGEAHNSYRK